MRFGLAGAGNIGQVRAKALKGLKDSDLVAVSDVDLPLATKVASSYRATVAENYQQMLELDYVDAVIVSTPPQYHEDMVLSALESGKHVICEKPLSNSVESCQRMLGTATRTGKTLATGFNQRYFPAIRFVKETTDSGLIGELDHVRAFAGHTGLSEFSAPWMYDKKVIGGGALMDVGIHMIDLTRYLLNEVDEVYGIATGNIWNVDQNEDNGYALMRSPQGKVATLHATWSEWKGYRFHIEAYGTKGMARAYYAPMMSMAIYLEGSGKRRRKRNFYPMNILQEKLHGWTWTVVKCFQQEIDDFVRLCQGQPGTIADGYAGFRAVEIANAIYRSTEEKRSVRLTQPV